MTATMSKRQSVCPGCQTRPNRMRLTPAGSQYGCGKCNKWFEAGEIKPQDTTPASEPPPGESQAEPPRGLQGLTKMSVILGMKSRALLDAVEELVPKALQGTKAFLKSAQIAKNLQGSLGYGAVEFRRGLAFLHLRIEELAEPRASLGISRDGLDPGVRVQERVFVVVLFLKPARDPGFDIPLWARKKLCNERTIYKLRTATDLDAVFQVLQAT